MSKITKIHAREVLDSRGNPTIQVEVWTEQNGYGNVMVPSGASTGSLEAFELRDKDVDSEQARIYKNNWFGGKGVMVAVDNVNKIISNSLVGFDVFEQEKIDQKLIDLDGTINKKKLGANAILGTSLAILKAAANERNIPLYKYIGLDAIKMPVPMLNIINGGDHAANTLDFQEFMIVPIGAKTFRESLQMANKVFHNLAIDLKKSGHITQVGDEGGFAPNLKSHEEALDFLMKAIKKSGFIPSTKGEKAIAIALDAASTELYNGKKYVFKKLKSAIENKKPGFENLDLNKVKTNFSTEEMIEYLIHLTNNYPIISIEDGLAEKDWVGFTSLTKQIGNKVQIVGDDLVVTNPQIIQKAIDEKAINSVLIKLNQIGTFSETKKAILMAKKANMTAIISHRSGETEDTTIADLSVGLNTGQIKTGSMSRSDRIAKYNRLLAIEEELKDSQYDGEQTFYNLK